MLEIAGVKISRQTKATDCCGIPFAFGPKVLVEPGVALTLQDLRDQFKGKTELSAKSTLVLGAKSGNLQKKQVVFVPAEASDNEAFRIRGFKPKVNNT